MSSKKNKSTIIINNTNEQTLVTKPIESFSILNYILTRKISFLVIFISSIILYINTSKHNYALDDQLAIYENKFVTKGLAGIGDILTHDAFVGFFGERGSKLISGGRYRPLSFVTFALEWQFFGSNPMINHCINILFYGILCCTLYFFLSLLFESQKPIETQWTSYFNIAFIATLLYSFHPIHTEVVANIKGRDEILAFLFVTISLILYIKYYTTWTIKQQVLIFISFFLGIMSKENSITFLAILPLISYYKFENKLTIKIFQKLVPVIGAIVLYLFLRKLYTDVGIHDESTEILNNPFVLATNTQKYATIIWSFVLYIKLLLFPLILTHDYYFNQIPIQDINHIGVWAGIMICLMILYYIITNIKTKSAVVFGLIFFIITFSIVSNFFFTVGIIMNERFVFIPSLGFALVIASFLGKIKSPKISISLLSILLLLYAYQTIHRNVAWKDNLTLFSTDYSTSSHSAKVATSLGGSLIELADTIKDPSVKNSMLDSSIAVLNHSLNIYPSNSQTWLLLGNATTKRYDDPNKGIAIYYKALEYRPEGYFDGNFNLGISYYNVGNMDSAYKYIKIANSINPEHNETKLILSKIMAKKGLTAEALQYANKDKTSMTELAAAAREGGNIEQAMDVAKKALAIDPNDPAANYIVGICLARHMNQLKEGLPFLEKAVNDNTNNSSWIEDLAVAYGFLGQTQKTIPLFERVIALRPNEANGYFNLAASYYKLGNKAKAAELSRKGNLLKK